MFDLRRQRSQKTTLLVGRRLPRNAAGVRSGA